VAKSESLGEGKKRSQAEAEGLWMDGGDCKRTGIRDRARLLREDSHSGQNPAGERPCQSGSCGRTAASPSAEQGDPAGQHLVRSRGREPRSRCGKEVWTDANPAPAHEHFIYLIYTPTMTNESTHVPFEVQTPRRKPRPTPPLLSKGTQIPREKERSGSPLLTRALADKKK